MFAKDLREEMRQEKGGFLLVDVRETDEVADEPYFRDPSNPSFVNIPLTVLGMLPKEEVVARFESAIVGFGKPLSDVRVFVACRSGGRSLLAQEHLASLGIETENVEGGRNAWGEAL